MLLTLLRRAAATAWTAAAVAQQYPDTLDCTKGVS
jgi:hypothetical protein